MFSCTDADRVDLNIEDVGSEQFWNFHMNTGKQECDKAVADVYKGVRKVVGVRVLEWAANLGGGRAFQRRVSSVLELRFAGVMELVAIKSRV